MALLLPPPVAVEVDALRRALGDRNLERIPAHITLVPPVNVRDERMMDAVEVLRSAASAARPFSLGLGPAATFWPDTPVLHLPVSGAGLDALHALRDRVFADPLARPLSWPFVPHVTLHDEYPSERLPAAIEALAGYSAEVTIERVHLLQEDKEEAGRVWRPIADAALAAPAIVGRGGLELELSVSEEIPPDVSAFDQREWTGRDATRRVVTARRNGRVVGCVHVSAASDVGFVQGMLVAAEHRREGIGSHLLAATESLATDLGWKALVLFADAGSPGEALYRGRGWVETDRLGAVVQLRRAIDPS